MFFLLDILMWILPSLLIGWVLPQPEWAAKLQERSREWIKDKISQLFN